MASLLQLWVENLVLALAAGVIGAGAGYLALRGLLLLLPERFLPVAKVPLDSRVLAFTLALSLLTSILFGMLPALVTRRVDLLSSIGHRAVIGAGGVRLRQGLIALEIALTVVLLAASGLLIRTLIHLETMPPGFNPSGVITAKASLDDVRYQDPAAFRKLLNESLAAMRQIPGVQDAAVGLTLPYERALLSAVTLSDGKDAGREITTNEIYVTPGYFKTLQIPGTFRPAIHRWRRSEYAACRDRQPDLCAEILRRSGSSGTVSGQEDADRGSGDGRSAILGGKTERRLSAFNERGDHLRPHGTNQ